MRISDWSSDVCSSDLLLAARRLLAGLRRGVAVGDLAKVARARVGRTLVRILLVARHELEHAVGSHAKSPYGKGKCRADAALRSEERRVGKAGVRTGESWWWPSTNKKNRERNQCYSENK